MAEFVKLSPPASPSLRTPWSPYHSSLKLPGRVPAPGPSDQPSALVQEFKKQFTALDFLIEYKLLYLNCPKGIYILPSAKSLHEWNGVIFVRSGPFQSGVFRFTIYMPDGYPRLRPMVRFHSRVFHPYVHATNGALNLLRGLSPWVPHTHHIWHIVQFIADCFYKEETWESSSSEEEGHEHRHFLEEAKSCAQESLTNLYNPSIDVDGNMIQFKLMEDGHFQKAIATLVNGDLPLPPDATPTVFSSVKDQVKQVWDFMTHR